MRRPIKMSKTSLQEDWNIDPTAEKQRVNSEGFKNSAYLPSNLKSWWVEDLWSPVERLFVRLDISPNTITFIGLSLTTLAGLLIAMDHLLLGGWMVFFAASFDFLDGRVARITHRQSQAGAFLDSVMDRYMDFCILAGMAYFFRDHWALWLCIVALFGAQTTSYVRAKAESLGIKCSGGQMQRPERVMYLGLGCLISGYYECLRYPFEAVHWKSGNWPLVLALVFVAVVSNKVAIQRIRESFQQLKSR